MTFYHIRRAHRPRRGSQFYRDKNPRLTAAYCGDSTTSYDVGWYDKAVSWEHPDHGTMVPCAECLLTRQAEGGARREARPGTRGTEIGF